MPVEISGTCRRSTRVIAVPALLAIALVSTMGASRAEAYDGNSWLLFGPASTEPPSYSTNTYDRAFVREWENNPPRGYPTLSAANVDATKAAIKRYEGIVKDGGWEQVPQKEMQYGTSSSAVLALRKRLLASGDLRSSDASGYFDYYLEKAVKRFQASNGLTPTGIVDKRTLAALNVSATARLKQLKLGLQRLRQYVGSTGKKKYVVVNIPAAQIEAIEGDRVAERFTGVVGKPERKTPILTSSIYELNFNPVWRLPPTVIQQDLIPKGRQMQKAGKSVLVKYGIDAYDGNGRKLDPEKINWNSSLPHALSYSQQPGKDNPLGFVKINFNNEYAVYMHDTPSDRLFGRNFRAASSGCIRVQNMERLATWLLSDQGYQRNHIDELKKTGQRKDVRLKKPIPLYFVYITAWATEDGIVQFRRDLYSKDGVGATASAY